MTKKKNTENDHYDRLRRDVDQDLHRPIVTFLLSLITRFRDIAAFVLQQAIFSTPPLVSPKCPNVPLGVGLMAFGLRRAKMLR